MKKAMLYGLFALTVVGIFFSTSMVSAYRGDYSIRGPNHDPERHEAMERAFDTSDYDAWYELMTEDGRHPRVVDIVTEDNFELFVQAHDAGVARDYETAAALRAELGLNNGNGPKDGAGQGRGQGRRVQQNNFADADNDGNCYNTDQRKGRN